MTLGEKIQMLRSKEGLSQEQLAERLTVSRQSVSKWELGQSTPDLDYVIQLSDIFNVSLDYLVKDINPQVENTRTSIHKENNRKIFDDTVFTKFPFPLFIPAFIICSLFGFHKGWNWFGANEPTLLQKLPIPFIVSLVYVLLCLSGLTAWNTFWLIFLLIPVYYIVILIFRKN